MVNEARAEAPLLPLRLFRLKTLAGSNAVGFLLGASFYGYIFIGTPVHAAGSPIFPDEDWPRLAGRRPDRGGARRASADVRHPRVSQAGNGGRDDPDRGRDPVGDPGAWAFIPVSIGVLAGVTERDAGVASGSSTHPSSSAPRSG
ncbi:MAG TPA: hypothetical protein VHZ03_35515 [Trebonia sp.]|nr:hypothetical protein [Trebonia sp.]